jgi:hypothetical protein
MPEGEQGGQDGGGAAPGDNGIAGNWGQGGRLGGGGGDDEIRLPSDLEKLGQNDIIGFYRAGKLPGGPAYVLECWGAALAQGEYDIVKELTPPTPACVLP